MPSAFGERLENMNDLLKLNIMEEDVGKNPVRVLKVTEVKIKDDNEPTKLVWYYYFQTYAVGTIFVEWFISDIPPGKALKWDLNDDTIEMLDELPVGLGEKYVLYFLLAEVAFPYDPVRGALGLVKRTNEEEEEEDETRDIEQELEEA